MITVLVVNKQGNKILNYTCTDGKSTMNISKEQLIKYINAGNVINARIQNYKGQIIIRVSEANKQNIENVTLQNKGSCTENTIINYIEKAKNSGVDILGLDGLEVNTTTLQIRKSNNINKQSDKHNNANSIYNKLTDLYEKYFELGIIDGKLALIKCKINQSIVNVPLGICIIATGAFAGLNKVKTITIPLLCTTFQQGAFDGLVAIENIIISETSKGDSNINEIAPSNVKVEHYIREDNKLKEYCINGMKLLDRFAKALNLNMNYTVTLESNNNSYTLSNNELVNNSFNNTNIESWSELSSCEDLYLFLYFYSDNNDIQFCIYPLDYYKNSKNTYIIVTDALPENIKNNEVWKKYADKELSANETFGIKANNTEDLLHANSYDENIYRVVEKLVNIQEYAVRKLGIREGIKFNWTVNNGIIAYPNIYVGFSSGEGADYIPNKYCETDSSLDDKSKFLKVLLNNRESDNDKVEYINCLLIDFDAGGECYTFINWDAKTDKYSFWEARGIDDIPFNITYKEATDMFHLTNLKLDTKFTYEEVIEHIYELSIS